MHLTVFLLILLGSASYGMDNTPSAPADSNKTCKISTEKLIDSVLKTHPSVQASRQLILGSNAQVEGAKWNYYPTPSVDVSMASGRRNTTVRLDQPLWTGGKLDAAYNLALSRKNESETILSESSYQLADTLLSLLRSYLQATGNLQALEEGKNDLQSFEAMLERRIDAGVSALSDRELIRSRLAQIDADIASARARRNTAQAQIELLSGSKLDCAVGFSDQPLDQAGEPLETLRQRMFEFHPSLKRLDTQIKIAEAEREKARSAPWPNVSLRAEHQNGSLYTDFSTRNNLLYVAVQASPGAGLSAMSMIQSAQSKVLQCEFDKRSKMQELTDALLRDFDEYHTSKNRKAGLIRTIESSASVLESYTRLFIAGKRQWLDLVNASRELTQNKIALSDLKAFEAAAAYRLALKSGILPLENGEKQ